MGSWLPTVVLGRVLILSITVYAGSSEHFVSGKTSYHYTLE